MMRSIGAISAFAIFCTALLSGCMAEVDDPGSGDYAEQQSTVEEPVDEASQAVTPDLTWYCEGWIPDLGQYCLTRCTGKAGVLPVGYESVVPYGQCDDKAELYCKNHGWGVHYAHCWGYYY